MGSRGWLSPELGEEPDHEALDRQMTAVGFFPGQREACRGREHVILVTAVPLAVVREADAQGYIWAAAGGGGGSSVVSTVPCGRTSTQVDGWAWMGRPRQLLR